VLTRCPLLGLERDIMIFFNLMPQFYVHLKCCLTSSVPANFKTPYHLGWSSLVTQESSMTAKPSVFVIRTIGRYRGNGFKRNTCHPSSPNDRATKYRRHNRAMNRLFRDSEPIYEFVYGNCGLRCLAEYTLLNTTTNGPAKRPWPPIYRRPNSRPCDTHSPTE